MTDGLENDAYSNSSPLSTYDSPGAARHFARERFRGRGAREQAIVGRLLRRHGRAGLLVDVPCGALRFLPHWRQHGGAIVAGDHSEAMLREAALAVEKDLPPHPGAAPVRLVRLDAFALPLPDRCADTLVCLRLLHHFPDGDQVSAILRELARVAAGIVLTSFFDARTLQHLRRRIRGRIRGRVSQRHALPRRELLRRMDEAGLEPVEIRSVLRGLAEQVLVVARPR